MNFNDTILDQVLLIDKPDAMTSFGVVARVRRKLSEQAGKKVKVGHCGTLDPFATGLLIIVTGKECRNAGQYSKLDKVYEATLELGKTSTTGDPEGELTAVSDAVPTRDEVLEALASLTGDLMQTPPIFSAIKVNGERAYKHARAGREIVMQPRPVTIFSLDLLDYAYPAVRIRTHVSSGTYIRSLAEDIGRSLGTGAYLTQLRRTRIAEYDIADATPLENFMAL